jgi:hypothetical protein
LPAPCKQLGFGEQNPYKMKTQNLEFQISQLRQDKIIYAVEACAFNLAAVVAVNLMMLLRLDRIYLIAVALFALGYTIFMALGNLKRLSKIKQLEKKL